MVGSMGGAMESGQAVLCLARLVLDVDDLHDEQLTDHLGEPAVVVAPVHGLEQAEGAGLRVRDPQCRTLITGQVPSSF